LHFVTGEDGRGKSALISLLGLERPPADGTVTAFGIDVVTADRRQRSALRRRIGIVHRRPRLVPWLGALDNVTLPLSLRGRDDADSRRRAQALLVRLGVTAGPDDALASLSAGQRRLLTMARALITRPRLLLLDDPYHDLDAESVRRVMTTSRALTRLGTAVVVALPEEVQEPPFPAPCLLLRDRRLHRVSA
jgi:ABC-type ATPase involved in cell division